MGSRDLLLEFWDLLQADWSLGVLTKKCEIRSGSRDLLYAILGPLPGRLVTGGTNEKRKIRSTWA